MKLKPHYMTQFKTNKERGPMQVLECLYSHYILRLLLNSYINHDRLKHFIKIYMRAVESKFNPVDAQDQLPLCV